MTPRSPLEELAEIEREMRTASGRACMNRTLAAGACELSAWAARLAAARGAVEEQVKALQDANELNDKEWREAVKARDEKVAVLQGALAQSKGLAKW